MDAMREVTKYTLRDASDGDREFLLEVYAAGRALELNALPWDDAMKRAFVEHQFNAQSDHYREHYPDAEHKVILVDGKAAGRVYVNLKDGVMIELLDITVLDKYRRLGIGTAIIEEMLRKGRDSNRVVRVYTEEFNPSLRLFERLGFEVTEKDGFLCRLDAAPR
jgi:GNAT superfamily N-acetyltransferase